MDSSVLIAANWKMNLNPSECERLARQYREHEERGEIPERVQIIVSPPTASLAIVASVLKGSQIGYGAQNVFWLEHGAYTGETAASSLAELGCTSVIIGHSERRKYLGETDEMVNRKVHAALDAGLVPIVCVGENYDERRENRSDLILMRQVIEGLQGITLREDHTVIIAYEPVWVIGTGQALDPGMAVHAAHVINQALIDVYPSQVVQNQTRIIYGGSVDATNITSFAGQEMISGALVGTASLTAESFFTMVGQFS